MDEYKEKKQRGLLPIELRSNNFDSSVSDGSAWLIEFYAPCKSSQVFSFSFIWYMHFLSVLALTALLMFCTYMYMY